MGALSKADVRPSVFPSLSMSLHVPCSKLVHVSVIIVLFCLLNVLFTLISLPCLEVHIKLDICGKNEV